MQHLTDINNKSTMKRGLHSRHVSPLQLNRRVSFLGNITCSNRMTYTVQRIHKDKEKDPDI